MQIFKQIIFKVVFIMEILGTSNSVLSITSSFNQYINIILALKTIMYVYIY